MSEHTEGDWKAVKNLRSTGWYVECDGVELATVNERLAHLTPAEAEANARLMAAAPTLLDLLRRAHDEEFRVCVQDEWWVEEASEILKQLGEIPSGDSD